MARHSPTSLQLLGAAAVVANGGSPSSSGSYGQLSGNFIIHQNKLQLHKRNSDLPRCAVARVIEQCCFNSTPNPFNVQTANFISKLPKVIESRTYVKKANLECY